MADQVQGSSKKRKSPDSAVGDQPDPPSRNTKRSKNESTMADKAADFRVFYDAVRIVSCIILTKVCAGFLER